MLFVWKCFFWKAFIISYISRESFIHSIMEFPQPKIKNNDTKSLLKFLWYNIKSEKTIVFLTYHKMLEFLSITSLLIASPFSLASRKCLEQSEKKKQFFSWNQCNTLNLDLFRKIHFFRMLQSFFYLHTQKNVEHIPPLYRGPKNKNEINNNHITRKRPGFHDINPNFCTISFG